MDPASEGGPDLDKNPSCDLLMGSPQLLKASIITFTFNLCVKKDELAQSETVSANEHQLLLHITFSQMLYLKKNKKYQNVEIKGRQAPNENHFCRKMCCSLKKKSNLFLY